MIASLGWIVGLNGSPGSRQQPALRTLWLAAAAAVLVACGGGGSGQPGAGVPPPPTGSPPPQPVGKGSVVIRAITTAGMPVSDVSVALNGGFDGRSLKTDANGEAFFDDVPAGDAWTNLYGAGYYQADRRLSVSAGSQTRVAVTLLRASDAVPVLLAIYPATPSADGSRVTVEADIAVLNSDGSSRPDLVAGDFGLEGGCGWYTCVVDADGRDTGLAYRAQGTVASFNTVAVPPGTSSAVGVLIEQSAKMGTFDPQGLRLQATRDYFDRVLPPNLVTLATQRESETSDAPFVVTYGEFTSDGSRFRGALDELGGKEEGASRAWGAITVLAGFMKANLADVAGSPRPVMVSVDTDDLGPGDCWDAIACGQSFRSAVDAVRAAGVTVIAAGPVSSPASLVALSTGGAQAAVGQPSQWPVLFRALDALAVGGLPRYRVQLELDGGGPGVLVKGRTVRGVLTVRVGPDTQLFLWDISIPI